MRGAGGRVCVRHRLRQPPAHRRGEGRRRRLGGGGLRLHLGPRPGQRPRPPGRLREDAGGRRARPLPLRPRRRPGAGAAAGAAGGRAGALRALPDQQDPPRPGRPHPAGRRVAGLLQHRLHPPGLRPRREGGRPQPQAGRAARGVGRLPAHAAPRHRHRREGRRWRARPPGGRPADAPAPQGAAPPLRNGACAMTTVTELGPNMSLDDLRKEAKTRLEAASELEQKHTGPGTEPLTGADLEQVKRLLLEVDALHDRIGAAEEVAGLAQKTQQLLDHYSRPLLPAQPSQGGTKRRLTPGEHFVRSAQYLQAKNTGLLTNALNRLEFGVNLPDGTSLLEWKATLASTGASGGGSLVPTDVRSTVVDMLLPQVNVLSLIPRLATESDAIEYIQQTGQTLNAGWVAEATGSAMTGTDGRTPDSSLVYANVTAYVRAVAGWLPVTNRLLNDSRAMPGIVNTQLLGDLEQKVEQGVLSGDGTGENLRGIIGAPNVQTFARGTFNEVDALFHARTLCRTGSQLAPNAVIMHPADYEQVRLLRENAASATLGQYLMGPPNTLGVPTVFGLPVVESQNIAVNTVIVGNFTQGCAIFDREQASIRVGLINDQLIRNQQTILAEERLTFVIWRAPAFTTITAY